MPTYLQLASARNGVAIHAWGDRDWVGWIPIMSWSMSTSMSAGGGGSGDAAGRTYLGEMNIGRDSSTGQASGKRQYKPVQFVAGMDTFDWKTLFGWLTNNERVHGKLSGVPGKPGETPFGFFLSNGVLTEVRVGGGGPSSIRFALLPESVERRLFRSR